MKRQVLAGHFGPADDYEPGLLEVERPSRLDLGDGPRRLGFGIGKALSDAAGRGLTPSEVGIDLLVLAVHVHAADTRIGRDRAAQDGWTREIRLVVPVSDPDLWERAAVTLRAMLRFLTGDLWEVGFRRRPAGFGTLGCTARPLSDAGEWDGISLYSGGLDSLIGAIDDTVERRRPLYVSHAGEGAVSRPQADLFEELRGARARSGDNLFIERLRYAARFPKGLVAGMPPENTTRGRSFLFLALGAMAGSGLGARFDLRIPENGFIALNVPLDPTRLGATTTRTTHPFYLRRWNDLLCRVGIPGEVANPYRYHTKGEMVSRCKDQALLRRLLPSSMSCAHPATRRFAASGEAHCGTCVPCLIRRAAVLSAWGEDADKTGYRCGSLAARPLDAAKAEGQQVRGFQYAAARLARRPSLASILVHKPGPLLEDPGEAGRLAGVYARGMGEVGRLLGGVRTFSSKAPDEGDGA